MKKAARNQRQKLAPRKRAIFKTWALIAKRRQAQNERVVARTDSGAARFHRLNLLQASSIAGANTLPDVEDWDASGTVGDRLAVKTAARLLARKTLKNLMSRLLKGRLAMAIVPLVGNLCRVPA